MHTAARAASSAARNASSSPKGAGFEVRLRSSAPKGAVPAAYKPLVQQWGNLCPALSPALLAAQL
ncbi:hypothetical protein ACWDZX_38765, partial [Streptomyces collinus]